MQIMSARATDRARKGAVAVLAALAALLIGASPAAAVRVVQDEPIIQKPEWVERIVGSGYENDLYRTFAEGLGRPEVSAATWFAPTALAPGLYEVEVFTPAHYGTTAVRYEVRHKSGSSEVRINQAGVGLGGTWVSLGLFELGDEAWVRSTDAGGEPGHYMTWDAVRWTSAVPPPAPPSPAADEFVLDEPAISGPQELVTRFAGVGWFGDLLRVHSRGTSGAPGVTARWSVALSPGRFRVEAFIPREHATTVARYRIGHATGETAIDIDQDRYKDLWVALGEFDFGDRASVVSTDASGREHHELAWDALRLTRLPPAKSGDAASPQPEPTSAPSTGPDITVNANPVATAIGAIGSPEVRSASGVAAQAPSRATRVLPKQTDPLVYARPIPRKRPVAYEIGQISIDRPKGARWQIRCAPCLFSSRAAPGRASRPPVTGPRTINELRGRFVLRGSRLDVRVTRRGFIGRHYRVTFAPGRGGRLRRHNSCLPASLNTPRPCPAS